MAQARSNYLYKALIEEIDIHTNLVKATYGWASVPDGWCKEDKRRTFAKNIRYGMYYDPYESGATAKKRAIKMGLKREDVERASQLVMQQDPAVAAFHRELFRICNSGVRETRTWAGRRRRHLSEGKDVVREMCNQYMQGGGADLLNLTLVEIKATYPFVRLFYTRHDSFKLEIHQSLATKDVLLGIKHITEQPRAINGQLVTFPMTWTLTRGGVEEKWEMA